MFADAGIDSITVDASDRYFKALEGVTEPEQKRKVIGEMFIRVFEEEQERLTLIVLFKEQLPQTG